MTKKFTALLLVVLLLVTFCACGKQAPNDKDEEIPDNKTQTDEPETSTFELTSVGTFDDIYATLVDYALSSGNDVMIEENEELKKLYAVYPPGTGSAMVYDPYMKMTVELLDSNTVVFWGIGLPYNKDWVADGTVTAEHLLGFGLQMIRSTLPEMSEEQINELMKSLQWPTDEEFTEAVVNGVDPGTSGGALIIVNGGESIYTLTLMFNQSNSQFQLIFSNDSMPQ